MYELQGHNLLGSRIVIEWSKGTKRTSKSNYFFLLFYGRNSFFFIKKKKIKKKIKQRI